MQSQYSLLR